MAANSNMESALKVEMPGAGEQVTVHVRPGDTLQLSQIDLEGVAIDILGPDIIFSDPATGAKIIFPGLGLILFSDKEAPHMLLGSEIITPEKLLASVGTIHNITQKDYLSFTSLEINAKTEEQKDEEEQNQDKRVQQERDFEEFMANLQAAAPQREQQTVKQRKDDAEEIEGLLNDRSDLKREASGTPSLTPPKHSSASQTQSNPEQKTEDKTEDNPAEDQDTARSTFDFETRFLQLAALENSLTHETVGGSASAVAAFDPSNAAQFFSEETIDKASDNNNLTINADNSTFFDATHASRVLQYSPNLPDGFGVTEVVITINGMAAGDFQIYSIDYDTGSYNEVAATFDGTNKFILDAAALNIDPRGDINLIIKYDTTNVNSTYTFNLKATATFDPMSGITPPLITTLEFDLDKTVKIAQIDDATDLSDPAIDWYLETVPNANRIITGGGNDTITGGYGVDTISAGAGNDIIAADPGDGGGKDVIDGEGGIDTLTYTLRTDAITLNLGGAQDVNGYVKALVGSGGEFDLVKNIENITGGSGHDILTGNANANILIGGSGNDTLAGGLGNDTFTGGLGVDTLSYAYAGAGITIDLSAASINAGAGDVDTLSDLIENAIGSAQADILRGNSLDNILDGGAGSDTADYSTRAGTGGMNLTLAAYGGTVTFNTPSLDTDTLVNIENVTGTNDAGDIITGDVNNNIIRGMGGNDTLNGGDGADDLYGGVGSDILIGGNGTDYARFDDLSTAVTLTLTSSTGGTATSNGDTDTLSGIERFALSNQGDMAYGSTGDDIIYGGGGNDVFYSSAGNDYLNGESGTNTINYSPETSGVQVNLGNTAAMTGGNIGVDTLINIQNMVGSDHADILVGDNGVNNINGGDGDDYLGNGLTSGEGGVDTLNGGNGSDWLDLQYSTGPGYGFTGYDPWYDVYYTGTAVVNLSSGSMTQLYADSTGTLYYDSDIDYYYVKTLNTNLVNIENVTAEFVNNIFNAGVNFTSNASDNRFIGSAYNDTVTASLGIDNFDGRAGTDFLNLTGTGVTSTAIDWNTKTASLNASAGTLTFSNFETINALSSSANDTLSFINMTSGVTVATTGTTSISFFVDSITLNYIDNLEGSAYADTLYGNRYNNIIHGYNGNDIIGGGGDGNDTIYGDDGDDIIYITGRGNDSVDGGTAAETAGDQLRFDTLSSFSSLTLNLSGTATYTSSGTNTVSFSNFESYYLSAANDTVNGAAGNDAIVYGLGGNDQFYYSTGNDKFDGGSGGDTVDLGSALTGATVTLNDTSIVNITYLASAEVDQIAGIEHISATNYVDSITGDNNVNIIYTRNGNDTVYGLGGDDFIYSEADDDIVYGGDGTDFIDGGSGNDTIYGGTGNDTIRGGSGNDTMDGGEGSESGAGDLLDYSTENSAVTINMATGINTATGTSIGTDTFVHGSFESAGGGSGADTLIGDEYDNTLYGNAGDDFLYGAGGVDALIGGSGGNDTADYRLAAAGITAVMGVGASNDGDGSNDTFNNIESIIGSNAGSNTITGSTSSDNINGGDGSNDMIIASAGTDTLNGGAGTGDTVDYDTNFSSVIANQTSAGVWSVNKGGSTDTSVSGFEIFKLADGNDTFNLSSNSLSSLSQVDGKSGTDTVNMSGDLRNVNIGSIFTNIEQLNLYSATTAGQSVDSPYNTSNDANDFDLTQTSVQNMVGVGNMLELTIKNTFDLYVDSATDMGGGVYQWGDGTRVHVTALA